MKSPPVDPLRSLRYLDAMGIQVWRLRRGPAAASDEQSGGDAVSADEPTPSPGEPQACPPAGTHAIGAAGDAARSRQDPTAMDWPALEQAVRSCRACGLCETRTQTVFGVGDREADLMVIGEAPGADEDRQGEPFVGRAGQLLDLMLASIGVERRQVYIANILKCRPPGNRDPRPEESFACRGFLMRQIQLVAPRVILSVGRVSAQNLLETDEAVGRLRGRWFGLGPASVPLMVTYHPSYLLRSPEQKAKVWQDLQQVARRLHSQ